MRLQTDQIEPAPQPLGTAWSLGAETGTGLRSATEAERLEYLCELVAELRQMAEHASLSRLAAILALAHEEALQRLDNR